MQITDRTEIITYGDDVYRRIEAAYPLWQDLNDDEPENIDSDSELYQELEETYQSVDHGKFVIN